MTDEWLSNIDSRNVTGLIYIDLRKVFDTVNHCIIIQKLKMVHTSIVLPHMDYASIVWGRCPNMVNNDRITKLQKRSARVILRCQIRDISSKDMFNTMN